MAQYVNIVRGKVGDAEPRSPRVLVLGAHGLHRLNASVSFSFHTLSTILTHHSPLAQLSCAVPQRHDDRHTARVRRVLDDAHLMPAVVRDGDKDGAL